MWKPVGDSTAKCYTSLESTDHHIMRGGLRPPTQQGGRRLRRRPPCWASHYVVICGFQRGVALGSAVTHWFPHVRVNVATWVAFSGVPMSLGIPPHGYTCGYCHGQWDIRESHSVVMSIVSSLNHLENKLRWQSSNLLILHSQIDTEAL